MKNNKDQNVSFDLVFGGFKAQSIEDNDYTTTEEHKTCNEFIPKVTYYANTKQFSEKSSRKYPPEIGKLAKNVFNDKQKKNSKSLVKKPKKDTK